MSSCGTNNIALFQCTFDQCPYQSLSFKRFLNHVWDKHSVRSGFSYKCGISGCTVHFTNQQSFRRHLKKKHLWFYEKHIIHLNIATENCNNFVNEPVFDDRLPQIPMPDSHFDVDENEDNSSTSANSNEYDADNQEGSGEEDFDLIFAEFLLELREVYKVSNVATCFVCEKLISIFTLDRKMVAHALMRSLETNNYDIDYETNAILSAESPFIASCRKFSKEKALSSFIKQRENFVEPLEINLGINNETGKTDSYQYVPLLKTLGILLGKDEVFSSVRANMPADNQRVSTFQDGTLHQQNRLFNSEENALELILYHDDFSTSNPLGNKVSKYKLTAFYFVLGNLPPKFRSRLKDINLVLLAPASFVQKYGYREILKPMLEDISKLEKDGISLIFEGAHYQLKGTLSMVVADNLAAHALGGFQCSFSTVKHFCRFCYCTQEQLASNTHLSDIQLRTVSGYSNNVRNVEIDPSMASTYGIKSDSCLHGLNFFHVINGLPPDLAHDVFEGLAIDVLSGVVSTLLTENEITLNEINESIASFKFSKNDSKNKPQQFKVYSSVNFKIKQTACEMWNLIRLLPLIIGSKIVLGNSIWKLHIMFTQLIEKLCASSYSHEELLVLEFSINEFFEYYRESVPNVKLKPKSHYLKHYPEMIRKFGPLVKTLRFEAKHSYFKSISHISTNRRNLCQSLTKRHQFMMYLHYSSPDMLSHIEPFGKGNKEVGIEALSQLEANALVKRITLEDDDLLTEMISVTISGQDYYSGGAMLLKFEKDEYVFAVISSIISVQDNLFFICKNLDTVQFHFHYNSYEVEENGHIQALTFSEFLDWHPLSAYTVDGRKMITLRHFVPIVSNN